MIGVRSDAADDATVLLEEMQELRTPLDLDEIVATPSRSNPANPVPAAAKSGRPAVSADTLRNGSCMWKDGDLARSFAARRRALARDTPNRLTSAAAGLYSPTRRAAQSHFPRTNRTSLGHWIRPRAARPSSRWQRTRHTSESAFASAQCAGRHARPLLVLGICSCARKLAACIGACADK